MIKFKLEDAKKIGSELGIDFKEFSVEDFLYGMNIEAEHGAEDKKTDVGADDPLIAGKIALAHLLESPNYYKELEKMEKKLERKNEINMPKVYYCRHIEKGVARYDDGLYLVQDECLHKMKKSMAGVPVYVGHQEIDLQNLKEQADGYVSECFYNEFDGWFWAKFICVSDKCRMAIKEGYSVSNAYMITDSAEGGVYHNINYAKEVLMGSYTHLAVVEDPRYENAFILDEEDFKMYNNKLRDQKELHNNKKNGGTKMFKLFKFKKEEVKEIDNDTLIELENGKTIKIQEMIKTVIENEKDEDEKKKENEVDMGAKVKVGEKEMTIKELVNKYMEMNKNKKNEEEEEDEEEEQKKKENEDDNKKKEEEENEDDDKEKEEKKNAKEAEEIKKKLADAEKEKKIENEKNKKHFDKIKNDRENNNKAEFDKEEVEIMEDKIKRGKEKY